MALADGTSHISERRDTVRKSDIDQQHTRGNIGTLRRLLHLFWCRPFQSEAVIVYQFAALPQIYSESHAVAKVSEFSRTVADENVFDRLGVHFVSYARKHAGIIVMDECGNLENRSYLYQREILDTLDDDIPVIGVVKKDAAGWVDSIRNHPEVEMVQVTTENRDTLKEERTPYFKDAVCI